MHIVLCWLKIVNAWFKPEVPLDDKIEWKSVLKMIEYCNEEVKG